MITIGAKKVKNIMVGSKNVSKVYVGSKLVWSSGEMPVEPTNIYDKSVADIWAYVRYANKVFNISTNASNLMARCAVEPNTTYIVEILMDTRFRVFSYKGQPVSGTELSAVLIDELDNNGEGSINGKRRLIITTGTDHNMLYIGYWTSTGSLNAEDVRNSIKIFKESD